MTNQETSRVAALISNADISKRATTALMMFDNSKHNEISNEDLIVKVNEALRLIKALADAKSL